MRINIIDRGAVGDGKTLNTEVIQGMIEFCDETGGGTVVFPKGYSYAGRFTSKPM